MICIDTPPMGGWLGGSGEITNYLINLDIIEIIQFCLKIYDLWRHLHLCVTAAGLRAGNTWYTFITARVGPAVVRGRLSQHSVCYGDEYYFSTFVGWAWTNLTGRWRAFFAW